MPSELRLILIAARARQMPAAIHRLLYDLIRLLSPDGGLTLAVRQVDLICPGRSRGSVQAYLAALERDHWLIRHPGQRRRTADGWDCECNRYQLRTVAEFHAAEAAALLHNSCAISLEEVIDLPSCTEEAAREARAKWLPTLPPAPPQGGIEQEPASPGEVAEQAAEPPQHGRLRRLDPDAAARDGGECSPHSGRKTGLAGESLMDHATASSDALHDARDPAGGDRLPLGLGVAEQARHAGVRERPALAEFRRLGGITGHQHALWPPRYGGAGRYGGGLG
jgi:hypothetical protein